MNRFERLFFILERNPDEMCLGNKEVRGMVKIILTTEQIRILGELSGLPMQADSRYALAVFLKKAGENRLEPNYFSLQPNPQGNVRMETVIPYKLQEGETVFGVGLSVILKQAAGQRRFPLIAFQNMRSNWRSMLQALAGQQAPKAPERNMTEQQPQRTPNASRDAHFARHFTPCDPFDTTNPSYHWWRNTDMHRLNQVLAEMELTLPLELNKEGYLACGLFGHVLLGLYADGTLRREFFILGIPAKDQAGSGNYYSNSRWEATGATYVAEQEETGYWLTYIDCDTGKVVKVV